MSWEDILKNEEKTIRKLLETQQMLDDFKDEITVIIRQTRDGYNNRSKGFTNSYVISVDEIEKAQKAYKEAHRILLG
tara:strand:- start:1520 stop:1750 length:231 start_codon:yes stop_codon:yes gene_type:complete